VSASALEVWFWRQMATWSTLLKRDAMALEYWEKIVAARPDDATVLGSLAHRLAQAGRRPEAIATLRRAVGVDPALASAWYNLGYLQQESQQHDEAIASFDRALAVNAKLDLAHYGRALSLIKSGRLEEAIAPLRRNIELQPMSPFGYYQLAHVQHRLQRPEKVRDLIERLAAFEPQVAKQLEQETGVVIGVRTL
jgi:tetratricopeptide (TPR) repeat protein